MKRKSPSRDPESLGIPLISLHRVSRFYSVEKAALFDITFKVFKGEFVYIAGSSGAGKSTLLRMLNAVEAPDTGVVRFSGHNLAELRRPAIALLRRQIGFVFQDFFLVPELTVEANVGLPLEVAGFPRTEITRRVNEVLELVSLTDRCGELAGSLSGGEQQRAAIARALAPEPELILADEPTGNLDAYNADYILDLFEQAQAKGTTVIIATHDRMMMSARPHRIIALDQGRIVGMSPDKQQSLKEAARKEAEDQTREDPKAAAIGA